MSKILNIVLIFLSAALLHGCQGKFILDPIDPRLPKYTEKGNGVAGAYVDGEVWTSIIRTTVAIPQPASPGINFPRIYAPLGTDSLVVDFEGYYLGSLMNIQFRLKGLGIQSYSQLLKLNGQKITLDGLQNSGVLISNSVFEQKEGGVGQIYFKHVARNPSGAGTIISGTFGFTTNDDQESSDVSYGRFDYIITESLFVE